MQVLVGSSGPLKQTAPSCRACRHSSPSSWLLRDGPCIPPGGPPGAFIPAGRSAVHQPAIRATSPPCVPLPLAPPRSCRGFKQLFLIWDWAFGVSAVSQDISVELGHTVGVNRPGQEVGEFLVPPGFSPVPWSPVFIQCHKITRPFVPVFVEVG